MGGVRVFLFSKKKKDQLAVSDPVAGLYGKARPGGGGGSTFKKMFAVRNTGKYGGNRSEAGWHIQTFSVNGDPPPVDTAFSDFERSCRL